MAMTPAQPGSYRAAFNPLIRPYLVLSVGAALAGTIVLLPLALVWFCGVGQWWARHYFDKLECELRDTAIRYRKGILVQVSAPCRFRRRDRPSPCRRGSGRASR
jgi:hypothetical protein